MPVSVVLNGAHQPESALALQAGDCLYLRLADARGLGLAPAPDAPIMSVEGEPYLTLDTKTGGPVSAHLLEDGTLAITAAATAFAARHLGEVDHAVALSPIVPAIFLDYDIDVLHDGGGTRATALLEGTISGAWGVFSTSGIVAGGLETGGRGVGAAQTVRLDSSWLRDFPAHRLRLVLGDTLTRGSSWTGPARIAGIRLGTEFALAPEWLTWPLPELAGSSVLPSTLELVARQDRRDIPLAPGDFTYAWRPQFSGAGTVTMTLRDISGAVRTVTRSYYASQGLLRPGLVDFSVEAGALRRNYGVSSFDYGALMGGATLRRGMTDHLTLEARIEGGDGVAMGSAGGTILLANLLEVNLGGALSHGPLGGGHLAQIQAQRLTQSYSLTASYRLRSAQFRQVGEVLLPGSGASRELALSGSLALGRGGSVTAGYLRVGQGASRYAIASLGWSGNWRKAYVSLGAQHTMRSTGDGGGETSLIAGLTVPLGGGGNISLSADRSRSLAAIDRSPPGNLGLGYHLAGGYEQSMGRHSTGKCNGGHARERSTLPGSTATARRRPGSNCAAA